MPNWDEQTDIVVIGSGLAGLAAAIEAREAGASVAVLEKMAVTGGNTRISDGGLAAPGNFLQKRMGIADSPELFREDMLKAGMGLNHPELVKIVAEKAAAVIDWTREALGVQYLQRLDRFGGHSAARSLTTRSHSGVDIIKAQEKKLRELGVKIRTRCLLTALITDNRGAVRGVEFQPGYRFPEETDTPKITLRAGRAVVLATGGFGRDVEFRRLQNPILNESIGSTNHRGATSEGLVAALRIGAAPIHLSWIQTGPWACADEAGYGKGSRFASYSVYPTGILVDPATGRRIVNEWADRRIRSDAIIRTGRACVGIVDAEGARQDSRSLETCLKNEKVKGFEKLADLADAYGMPAGELIETVEEYNRRITQGGTDEFGKPLHQGPRPLSEPPFYAIRLWPKVHYTSGGVGINSRAQVLNLTGRPVPNLFAAGEVCGGIHGASRLGSCALTECLVFGRIAGQQAAVSPRS